MLNKNDIQIFNKENYVKSLELIMQKLGMWEIPTTFENSLSWYQAIKYVLNYLIENVLPAIDNNNDNLNSLYEFYKEIVDYVNNYFDDLDLQDEINNKLDIMANDGTLQEIIKDYISYNSILSFDTLNDLKLANNLLNGDYANTGGYFVPNDGGHALYKIRNVADGDVIDDIFIISLNNQLVAELILNNNNTLNLLQAGISQDTDILLNTSKLEKIIDKFKNGGTIIVPEQEILIDKVVINDDINSLTIKGETSQRLCILSSNTEDYMFQFNGSTQALKFENLQLKCNDISSGIKLAGASNMSLKLWDTTLYNCMNGIYALKLIYLDARFFSIGVSTNATNENFGMYYKGYEYNRFENCAMQVNGNNSHNQNVTLLHIEDSNYTWIKNCEFAKTGGKAIHLHANNGQVYHTYIDNCILYRTHTGFYLETTNYSINNLQLLNNNFTLQGMSAEESVIKARKNGAQKINIKLNNININRLLNVSPTNVFDFPDDTIAGSSFENLAINYTNGVPINFNNNTYEKLSTIFPSQSKDYALTCDGTSDRYDIIFQPTDFAYCPNKPPKPLISSKDNMIQYPFAVSTGFYDTNKRYRFVIKFLVTPPAGTYNLQVTPMFV